MKINMLMAAAVLALAGPAAAQTAPSYTGPYLWAQQATDNVVMVAMGTRRQSGANWTATSVTVFDLPDAGQVRADAVVEVDCVGQTRRTTEIYLYSAADADRPVGPVATVPGVDWSPPGPADGPLMNYICTGQHDASRVHDRISAHVAKWRSAP